MSWTFVVLALVLFLFAIYIGFLCGQWACEKRVITKRDYWIANFAGAAAVVLLTWVFSLFPLVQFAPIGWLGGFIAGLKMSFGESVGPWRKHDEVFNVNKAHRAAADAGDAEERRRARRNGAADRQLISVTDDSNRPRPAVCPPASTSVPWAAPSSASSFAVRLVLSSVSYSCTGAG